MYKIMEYTFDKFTLLGYYDKEALTGTMEGFDSFFPFWTFYGE